MAGALGKIGEGLGVASKFLGGASGAGKPKETQGAESKGDGETVVLDKETFNKLVENSSGGGVGLGPNKANTIGIG
jgi:hypothetical protein